MATKPKILFATPVLHHPPVGGPTLRIENSIKALSQISALSIYSRVSLQAMGGGDAAAFYQQYCQSFYFAPSVIPSNKYVRFARRVVNFLAQRTIKRNVFRPGSESPEKDFGDLLRVADAIQADVIWLGYGNISYPLLKYIKTHSNYKVVVDTDSVWSRFVLRGLPFARSAEERQKIEREGQAKEEEERWGTQRADVTTAVSLTDAEYYRGLAQDPQKVHIFPNVVDVSAYQQVPPPAADLKKPCLYLAGTFWPNSPMEDATRWVIREVLPLIRQLMGNVHLYIVGKGSDQVLSDVQDQSVNIMGQVLSVLPYLCHADVALVPLRFESGTRFKILEAFACHVPVVSTTLGAEGLNVVDGQHLLFADTPAQFAEAIQRVFSDDRLRERLISASYTLVDQEYSLPAAEQQAKSILRALGF